jgi:hypothetical protein
MAPGRYAKRRQGILIETETQLNEYRAGNRKRLIEILQGFLTA